MIQMGLGLHSPGGPQLTWESPGGQSQMLGSRGFSLSPHLATRTWCQWEGWRTRGVGTDLPARRALCTKAEPGGHTART